MAHISEASPPLSTGSGGYQVEGEEGEMEDLLRRRGFLGPLRSVDFSAPDLAVTTLRL